ncbi:hypothetical protein FB45DRAFT_749408, partial [Roridomyces roridus]
MGNQLADYQLRGNELKNICAWDFISHVDRIRKSTDRRRLANRDSDDEEDHDDDENELEEQDLDLLDDQVVEDNADEDVSFESIFESEAHKRPRVSLLKGHSQEKTHLLRVRSPNDLLVPVPIGPGIPRRDKPEIYPRYCRLMLIFFKPWRHAKDLRDAGQTWEKAFELFIQTCTREVKQKMNNMQILHECRDSRDD